MRRLREKEEQKINQKTKKPNHLSYEVDEQEEQKHKFFPTSFGALLNYITYKNQKQVLNKEINDVTNCYYYC